MFVTKARKRDLSVAGFILIIDTIFHLTSYATYDLEMTAFNFGFTAVLLIITYSLIENFVKIRSLKIEDSMLLGGLALSSRSVFSLVIAYFLDGSLYGPYFAIQLLLNGLVQGVSYGAISWWLGKKVIK